MLYTVKAVFLAYIYPDLISRQSSFKTKFLLSLQIIAKEDVRPQKLHINSLLAFAAILICVNQKLVVTNSDFKKSITFRPTLGPIFVDIFTKFVT